MPAPIITSIDPTTAAENQVLLIDVYGENFVEGCVVLVDGIYFVCATAFVSDTHLVLDLSVAQPPVPAGPYDVRVYNPEPPYGDGLSGVLPAALTITTAPPKKQDTSKFAWQLGGYQ